MKWVMKQVRHQKLARGKCIRRDEVNTYQLFGAPPLIVLTVPELLGILPEMTCVGMVGHGNGRMNMCMGMSMGMGI